jgi:nucleoside phosphorylase
LRKRSTMLCDQAANEKKGPIDFAIITALKLERDAVLQRLDEGYEQVQEDEEPLTYYYGHITIPSSGERYSVVLVMLLKMGNDEAAVATTRLIRRWQPQHALMVGIAGGVPGKGRARRCRRRRLHLLLRASKAHP